MMCRIKSGMVPCGASLILIGMITWMEQLGPGIISALLRCLTAEFRAAVRAAIGQFGFVSAGRFVSVMSPDNTEDDLNGYITEILQHSKEEFEQLWGDSPLVMKKYEILCKIITDELGVEL